MAADVFQSLWIGAELSVMEQLSIRSFLANGYEFHLYTYQDVSGIPPGTTIRSGEEILPADQIFCYRKGYGKGSYAAFSNGFRYKLLLERGGWWTDLDSVCMQPIELAEEHILGKERSRTGGFLVACGMIKAPPSSPLMKYCWEVSQKVDRGELLWGQIGPRLMTEAVDRMSGLARLLEPQAFYPIDFWRVWRLISTRQIPTGCYTIHLWHSCWRREHLDPNAQYGHFCIYEQLKRRYGVTSPSGVQKGPGFEVQARHWWRELKNAWRKAA
ncbi:MAG: hypothetical protein ABSG53_00630 [Thermoguttaceae bacterium]|jgi:hypothetical protein